MAAPRPHGICARCSAVVPLPEGGGDPTCPACGHVGPPAGTMRPTGVPDLATYRRNIGRAHGLEDDEG